MAQDSTKQMDSAKAHFTAAADAVEAELSARLGHIAAGLSHMCAAIEVEFDRMNQQIADLKRNPPGARFH
jgi:hypothetical protein